MIKTAQAHKKESRRTHWIVLLLPKLQTWLANKPYSINSQHKCIMAQINQPAKLESPYLTNPRVMIIDRSIGSSQFHTWDLGTYSPVRRDRTHLATQNTDLYLHSLAE